MKIILFFVLIVVCEARKFTRCRLAKELNDMRMIEKTFLGSYVPNSYINKGSIILCACAPCMCFLCVTCKTFERRCKPVRELLRVGIPSNIFLGQWVCLIEKVSNRDTSAFVVSPSGRKYYGLYQIPSKWCREGKKGGDCNIACESLLDDDIRDDTACALIIFHREGFKYWTLWNTRCKNNNFITNEIYKCPDFIPRLRPERNLPIESMKSKSRHTRNGIHRRIGSLSKRAVFKK